MRPTQSSERRPEEAHNIYHKFLFSPAHVATVAWNLEAAAAPPPPPPPPTTTGEAATAAAAASSPAY